MGRAKAIYIDPFTTSQYLNAILSSSSPILKSIAYKTMSEVVDLLDVAAKEVKASQNFESLNENVFKFKEILKEYMVLSRNRFLSLSFDDQVAIKPISYTIEDYNDTSEWVLETRPHALLSQLLPSLSFNVSCSNAWCKNRLQSTLSQDVRRYPNSSSSKCSCSTESLKPEALDSPKNSRLQFAR